VLDVGCGGGAGGLALVPPAASVTGVDSSPELLDAFVANAADLGVSAKAVAGDWPAAAGAAGRADVVVCHHVLYNVADLEPFVVALSAATRRRVVVELGAAHPWVSLAPLWARFHGLARPDGPRAELAAAALREFGIQVREERVSRLGPVPDRRLWVGEVRRRLCLPAAREPDVDEALGELAPSGQEVVTLWWDASAGSSRVEDPPGAQGGRQSRAQG
jgi:SAM-dependent methyltransferase